MTYHDIIGIRSFIGLGLQSAQVVRLTWKPNRLYLLRVSLSAAPHLAGFEICLQGHS